MANLAYDSNIFTKVNKWDSQYSYRGILLSDKINQKNGQDYKLLDAIDIDWNGMWASFASTYVYDTKDLLDVLAYIDPAERLFETNKTLNEIKNSYLDKKFFNDIVGTLQGTLIPGDHILLNPETTVISTYNLVSQDELQRILSSYVTTQYLEEYSYSKQQTISIVNEKIEELVGDANENFDTIKEIADWIMEQSEYTEIPYDEIDFSSGNRYYIFKNGKYIEVDEEYVNTHPDDTYYVLHTSMDDVGYLKEKVSYIITTIGDITYEDEVYTYSGIIGDLQNLHNADNIINTNIGLINTSIDNLYRLVSSATSFSTLAYNTANQAYEMSVAAYDMALEEIDNCRAAYDMAYTASYAVGETAKDGYFREVTEEEIEQMQNGELELNTFLYRDNSYQQTNYSSIYTDVTWYTYVDPQEPTGMRKEIKDLTYNVNTSLYNLKVDNSYSNAYVWLNLSPATYNGSPERTIKVYSQFPDISLEERLIKKDGIITALTMNDVLSYMFDWEDL